jgi:hypothetical protein
MPPIDETTISMRSTPRPSAAPIRASAQLEAGSPRLVVLAVLDTVRATSLALCGGRAGTSEALSKLVQRGATFTCHGYAPATWTLPSHVSFFTGKDTPTHTVIRKGQRLAEADETLAETFQARGYQTLFISANPVLHARSGVHDGFDRALVANTLNSPLRGEGMATALQQELARLDPEAPLFVFLNVFDAHDPYPPVPEEMPGFTPGPPFVYQFQPVSTNPYFRFIKGDMDPVEQEAWLKQAREGYEFGVASADRALGRALKVLMQSAWFKDGVRLVVTSDHGENLGEHGRIRHDGPAYEPVSRVATFYFDTTRPAPLPLPEPFPGEAVFELIRDGALPDPMPPAASYSIQFGTQGSSRFADSVAWWPSKHEKVLWINGTANRYNLATDPAEATPEPVDVSAPAASEWIARQASLKAAASAAKVDDEVVKMLEAVGYVGE